MYDSNKTWLFYYWQVLTQRLTILAGCKSGALSINVFTSMNNSIEKACLLSELQHRCRIRATLLLSNVISLESFSNRIETANFLYSE